MDTKMLFPYYFSCWRHYVKASIAGQEKQIWEIRQRMRDACQDESHPCTTCWSKPKSVIRARTDCRLGNGLPSRNGKICVVMADCG